MQYSTKVVLTGSYGVGKTSLFNQFLSKKFDERYLTTIGVKVDKKVIQINGHDIAILLWDIAGERNQEKIPSSYFLGANSIIFVIDLTRPSTYVNLKENIKYIKAVIPNVQLKVVANKKDLIKEQELQKMIQDVCYPIDLVTSAKTGEIVEELFRTIGLETLTPT